MRNIFFQTIIFIGFFIFSRSVLAFEEEGAFNPRILITKNTKWEGVRKSGPAEWSKALVDRTSAPSKSEPTQVKADSPELLKEPFIIWAGDAPSSELSDGEIKNLQTYLKMGSILLIDDSNPENGKFSEFAKKQLRRVVPNLLPTKIGKDNVLYHSFYLLDRPTGRVSGPDSIEAIFRNGLPQVIFLSHDLLGALAKTPSGAKAVSSEANTELAIRFAINIAMYALCSNYKDDQVHAPFLMRRHSLEKK